MARAAAWLRFRPISILYQTRLRGIRVSDSALPDSALPDIKIADFGVSRLSSGGSAIGGDGPGSQGAGSQGAGSDRSGSQRRGMKVSASLAPNDLDTVALEALGAPSRSQALAPALIERTVESASDTLAVTRVGEITGTPHYIAPEAAEGKIAPPSDMFSLGVLSFEVLVGQRPFAFPVVLALAAGQSPERPEKLLEECPHLPAEIAALVQSCLSLSPEARPSAQFFADELRRLMRSA